VFLEILRKRNTYAAMETEGLQPQHSYLHRAVTRLLCFTPDLCGSFQGKPNPRREPRMNKAPEMSAPGAGEASCPRRSYGFSIREMLLGKFTGAPPSEQSKTFNTDARAPCKLTTCISRTPPDIHPHNAPPSCHSIPSHRNTGH
jgi:hypothetical protein